MYRAHHFDFGNQLLQLRTRVALTQIALAKQLGVHRRSVQNWETGISYPKPDTLQRLIAVFLHHQAFTPGNERAEAQALWDQAAQDGPHTPVDFDEVWFARSLERRSALPTTTAIPVPPQPMPRTIVDWGEAPAIPVLVGREQEISTLQHWIAGDRCRVVTIVGIGGIGKSSLAVTVAQQVRSQFEVVLFRSLHNAPPLADVLDQTIRAVSNQQVPPVDRVPDKIALLVQLFRERRCLFILDNLEALMQPGSLAGTYRPGYADYGTLIQRLSEREHASCLLLTSREKPPELGPLEGRSAPVRTMLLGGLNDGACRSILEAKDIVGTATEIGELARRYGGNPLAMLLVAEPIRLLFGNDVGAFLGASDAFVDSVGTLMEQQCARSTPLERSIMFWLAIEREQVPLSVVLANLGDAVPRGEVLGALESLRRRTQIEPGLDAAFNLQPVIREFVTGQVIRFVSQEIVSQRPSLLNSHALIKATAKEYVRRSQERLIATPLLERLIHTVGGADTLEHQLLDLLAVWRDQPMAEQGYGPGNIINLLRLLRGHLRELDLSRVAIRQAYLQDVNAQDTKFTGAVLNDSVFTGSFDIVTSLAISSENTWAAGSRSGEVLVWSDGGRTLHRSWQAHTDRVHSIAWSPDGRTLVTSGSWDGTLKLWDITGGSLTWVGRHPSYTKLVAFRPDGSVLVSSANDATIRLWDAHDGTQLHTLLHPEEITAIAWSSNGSVLATGDASGCIRLWRVDTTDPIVCVQQLVGHSASVEGLAFAPDGTTLASASWDTTVKLWDIDSGQVRQTLAGHNQHVQTVQWSRDGRVLASGARDGTLRLWERESTEARLVLYGHTDYVNGLAFTSDSRCLLSSSDDGTLRVWDVASGHCLRVIHGHAASLCAVAWSPDGAQLLSGGSDTLVTMFDVTGERHPRILRGHTGVVMGVGWSPDRQYIASSEWNNTIRLWDSASGDCLELLQHPDDPGNFIDGLAWSPVAQRLACGTYHHGVLVWDLAADRRRMVELTAPTWIRHLAWSPDGNYLAGGGADGTVYVWDAAKSTLLHQLTDHHSTITSVSWRPDGAQLASASSGQTGAEIFVWDMQRGERRHAVVGDSTMVYASAWGSDPSIVVSGGLDGTLRWWNLESGACVRECAAHQGTIQALRRSPDGTKLASCGDDGRVVVWDLHSGAQLQTLRRDRPYERLEITGLTGITDAQRTSLLALGAVENNGADRVAGGDRMPSIASSSQPITDRSQPDGARHGKLGPGRKLVGLPFRPTTFIGRSAELAALTRMLGEPTCRLLTLLGPGGIGKTRLAMEAATRLTDAFPDGVAFVTLASIGAADQIVSAIGETLSLAFTEQPDPTAHLLRHLRAHHMLLILDSFEHLTAGADLVAEILDQAPYVSVLVTSRERLHLQAEWLFDVEGLAYPPESNLRLEGSRSVAELATYSALQLFEQRARQVQPGLSLSLTTLSTIARICQHVEGMPLAIELAAANVRTAPVAEIERQIRSNLDALTTTRRDTPARHRSLRAVFEHSWTLLDEPERIMLSRLAVFRGGWTAPAAQEVAGATLPAISTLLDKSLVRQETVQPDSAVVPLATEFPSMSSETEQRFVLPQPIREYAREHLAARGEAETLLRVHAAYYLALAEAAMEHWDGATADAAIAQLNREYDNIRAALQWARDGGDRTLGLQLAGVLRKYWRRRGAIGEGRAWLEALLAGAHDLSGATAMTARLRATEGAAWLASDQHDYVRATQLFEQMMALRHVLGVLKDDTPLVINAAVQARMAGQYGRASALLDDVITQQRALGNRRSLSSAGLGLSLYLSGLVRREQGEFARAGELFQACIELHRELGDREGVAIGLLGLSDIARDQGAVVQARTYSEECLAQLRTLGVQWAVGFALNNLALAAAREGQLQQADMLVSESIALFGAQQADGSLAEVLVTKGQILLTHGRGVEAYTSFTEALRLAQDVGPRVFVANAMESLGSLATLAGHAVLAVRLLGAAATVREQMGTPVRPADQPALALAIERLSSNLGVPAFTAMWESTATLQLEQILSSLPGAAAFDKLSQP